MFSLQNPGPHLMAKGFGEAQRKPEAVSLPKEGLAGAHWTTQAEPQGPWAAWSLTRPLFSEQKTGEAGRTRVRTSLS